MLKNLRIGKKLTIGFGVVLGLMVIVGASAFFGLNNASNGFTAYREMARDTNLAGRLQANMLMVRMNVKDFIITGSDSDLKQYESYLKEMNGFLESAQKNIQDPQRAEKIDRVDENLKDYRAGFTTLTEMKNQRNAYVNDTLNVIGPQMERDLSKIMTSANADNDVTAAYEAGMALRNLLLGRLYVTKFLDTNAQQDADRVDAEFAAFDKQLQTLDRELQNPERRALLKNLQEMEMVYHPTFQKLSRLIFDRNALISGTLDRIGPIIAANVEDVKLDIKAEQDRLGPALVASNRNTIITISVVTAVAIGIGIFLAIFLTRGITGPLSKGVEFAKVVELGDLESRIEIDQADEVGQLADAMRNMVDNLRNMVDLAEQIADGNLTVHVQSRSEKDALAHALQAMVNKLSSIVAEINTASAQVATGAQQLSETSQSMAQGATEQASSLEEISSSMTEIESQTKQSADNASQANQFVTEVRNSAERGNEQMKEMVSAMHDINESSQSISKIIKVIDEIAFQTNLLALNAAVEAARAGAHGKGFAVVAEEVRNLAARSATAAKETSDLIEGAVKKAETGSEISKRTEEALAEIVTSVTKVSDLVGEISAASIEQAEGVSQITTSLEQIDQITQQNSAHSEESASAAEELASQAELLRQSISSLRISDRPSYASARENLSYGFGDNGSGSDAPRESDAEATASKPVNGDRAKGMSFLPEVIEKKQNGSRTIHLDDDDFGRYA